MMDCFRTYLISLTNTINETSVVCPDFLIDNHFTDNNEIKLVDFGFFFTLRKDKKI